MQKLCVAIKWHVGLHVGPDVWLAFREMSLQHCSICHMGDYTLQPHLAGTEMAMPDPAKLP